MLEYILMLQIIRLDYIQSLNKKAYKRMEAYDQVLACVPQMFNIKIYKDIGFYFIIQ